MINPTGALPTLRQWLSADETYSSPSSVDKELINDVISDDNKQPKSRLDALTTPKIDNFIFKNFDLIKPEKLDDVQQSIKASFERIQSQTTGLIGFFIWLFYRSYSQELSEEALQLASLQSFIEAIRKSNKSTRPSPPPPPPPPPPPTAPPPPSMTDPNTPHEVVPVKITFMEEERKQDKTFLNEPKVFPFINLGQLDKFARTKTNQAEATNYKAEATKRFHEEFENVKTFIKDMETALGPIQMALKKADELKTLKEESITRIEQDMEKVQQNLTALRKKKAENTVVRAKYVVPGGGAIQPKEYDLNFYSGERPELSPEIQRLCKTENVESGLEYLLQQFKMSLEKNKTEFEKKTTEYEPYTRPNNGIEFDDFKQVLTEKEQLLLKWKSRLDTLMKKSRIYPKHGENPKDKDTDANDNNDNNIDTSVEKDVQNQLVLQMAKKTPKNSTIDGIAIDENVVRAFALTIVRLGSNIAKNNDPQQEDNEWEEETPISLDSSISLEDLRDNVYYKLKIEA
jgi:hypothetical protein